MNNVRYEPESHQNFPTVSQSQGIPKINCEGKLTVQNCHDERFSNKHNRISMPHGLMKRTEAKTSIDS